MIIKVWMRVCLFIFLVCAVIGILGFVSELFMYFIMVPVVGGGLYLLHIRSNFTEKNLSYYLFLTVFPFLLIFLGIITTIMLILN